MPTGIRMYSRSELATKRLFEGGFLDELDGDGKPLTKGATKRLLKKVTNIIRNPFSKILKRK